MRTACRRKFLSSSFVLLIAFAISSCSIDPPLAPVGYPGSLSGDYYHVQKGDTLYSIAFRFGLDYKSVARANRISPPYTIYIHQKIRIKGVAVDQRVDSAPTKPESPVSQAVIRQNNPVTKATSTFNGKHQLSWKWPIEGPIVKKFALNGEVNKGIDIEGKAGEAVRASEEGIVVYAGGGLRGYGKLVIVKHNDRYLSAYGNNEKLMVKEGQKVKAGEKIARIGQSGEGSGQLHFEIRRDGKPQNPLHLLPIASPLSGAEG